MSWFSTAGFWPSLDSTSARAFCAIYGVLLFGTIAWALPSWRRFFVSERWGGYLESSRETDLLHRPGVVRLALVAWLGCAGLLMAGRFTVVAALLNLILCRHLFVRLRWRGVLRGMGAPGFMSYWLSCAVFLVEYGRHHAPTLLPLAIFVLQVDFAFIMLSAGLYKLSAGYARNNGMELGMVNPEWGYWGERYRRMSPGHLVFRALNQLAWSTEVVAAILMLVPATRLLGAALIMISFVFIATHIRLGLLCEMVILCGFLFFHPGSAPASWLAAIAPAAAPVVHEYPSLTAGLRIILWGYLALLPLAHGGLFYNFYARKTFFKPIQIAFERYTNFFGIIIWRVFSVDVINFFINVYRADDRKLISKYGLRNGFRFAHVGESITITSLFTTLKYYPSNNQLFVERLLRYARTLGSPRLVFEYVSVVKRADHFAFVPVAEYTVDVEAGTVVERLLDPAAPLRAAHPDSPVHEGARPGSYAALGS